MKYHVKILVFVAAIALSSRAADEPIKIACVGDSITFGAGVEDRDKNHYPLVLGKLLGEK